MFEVLETCGRRSEPIGLTWDRVDTEDRWVYRAATNSHKDCVVPIDEDLAKLLYRLKAPAMADGRPFRLTQEDLASQTL